MAKLGAPLVGLFLVVHDSWNMLVVSLSNSAPDGTLLCVEDKLGDPDIILPSL